MKVVPILISAAMLGGIALRQAAQPTPEDAAPFHTAVRLATDAAPFRVGRWTGIDVPLPPAAWSLLRPNALLSRHFTSDTGEQVTLILVQCSDARDMSGHYPPVCYPSRGWIVSAPPQPVMLNNSTETGDTSPHSINSIPIPATRYEFVRRGLSHEQGISIYDFFVLPRKGYASTMRQVRAHASDVAGRAFGAAQVQFVFDTSTGRQTEQEAIADLLTGLGPLLAALIDDKGSPR